MFFLGLDVEILFQNDTTEALEELDLDTPLKNYDKKIVTFFKIDAISEYYDELDNNKEYTTIYSAGTRFITTIKRPKLKEIINRHLSFSSVLYKKN